ncbi:MAG: homoserine dehydrogenase, partial [Gammaproteobacteria bacterium]|nr:homoserine dehydrogenase [Gammaproteobacteria bacterium]
GVDAAHKLTIIGSIAFGIPLQFEKTYTEGITQVEQVDVQYASELGYRIKHLGITRKTGKGIELRVHPTLIPERRLIANVDGVMNAVLVHGDAVGPTLYYGAGAGAQPTASAVVADVVDTVRAFTSDPGNRVPHLAFQPDAVQGASLVPAGDVQSAYYLRLKALDQPGVLADVTRILADADISIEAILQRQTDAHDSHLPVVILTHEVAGRAVVQAAAQIEQLAAVTGPITRIRLQGFA